MGNGRTKGETMKRIILSIIVAGIWGLCFCASPAQAEPITIAIEAVVDRVDDRSNYLEGKISPGDIITGTYTYDPLTPDSDLSPIVGRYEHSAPPHGIFLSAGGFDFKTNTTNVDFCVDIINDSTSGGLHDGYGLISYNNVPLSNGANVDGIWWWLEDTSATALTDDALPVTPPILGQWQENRLHLDGERSGYIIRAHVTSAIPEPATMILLGLGALMLTSGTKK